MTLLSVMRPLQVLRRVMQRQLSDLAWAAESRMDAPLVMRMEPALRSRSAWKKQLVLD
jgi:hypothetical protein